MEYKKKIHRNSKTRKNGLQKTLSFRPARSNSFLSNKSFKVDYRNGKRHSAVSNTFCDISQDKDEVTSVSSVRAAAPQLSPNGQPFFCDKERRELINHQMSHEPYHIVDSESNSKYRKLQKMFSLPFPSTQHDIDDVNSCKISPHLEISHNLSGTQKLNI